MNIIYPLALLMVFAVLRPNCAHAHTQMVLPTASESCALALQRPFPIETVPDHRVQFESTFEIRAADGTPPEAVRDIVFSHISTWLKRSRMIPADNKTELLAQLPSLFTGDHTIKLNDGQVHIASRFAGEGRGHSWALLFEHDDKDNPDYRVWRTDIGIVEHQPGVFSFNIGIQHFPRHDRMIHDDLALPNFWGAPNVLRQIFRDVKLDLRSGVMPLVTQPLKIKPGEAQLVKIILEDPARGLPVLLISTLPGSNPSVKQVADTLANQLAGQAVILWEERPPDDDTWSVRSEFRREYGEEIAQHIPYNGRARLFWPVLKPNDPNERLRHPILDFQNPEEWQGEDIALLQQNLTRGLNISVHRRGSKQVASIWDVSRAQLSDRIRQLQQAQKQAPQKDNEAELAYLREINSLYEQDNAGMSERIAALTTRKDDLEAQLTQERVQLEDARAQIRSLEEHSFRKESITYLEIPEDDESGGYDISEAEGIIRSVADAFPDQIVLSDQTRRSIRRLNFTRHDKLLEMMVGIATELHRLVFFEKSPDYKHDIKVRRNIDISGESAATRADSSIRRERTVIVDGQTYVGYNHAKFGVQEPGMIRIYFDFDNVNKRIIITNIATHMKTAGTKYQ